MGQKFNQIYENSIKNPEDFWKNVSEDIFWFKKPSKALMYPASPKYPPISITKDTINNLQKIAPGTFLTAARIK